MDGSWIAVADIAQGKRSHKAKAGSRRPPQFELTTGEVLTTSDAIEDPRNVHSLERKRLYRRLVAASRRGEALSPEQLWRAPEPTGPKGDRT